MSIVIIILGFFGENVVLNIFIKMCMINPDNFHGFLTIHKIYWQQHDYSVHWRDGNIHRDIGYFQIEDKNRFYLFILLMSCFSINVNCLTIFFYKYN